MNKDLVPNFTKKPNVIMDKYCRFISPSAYKVLDIICRKTYGFHKPVDKISIGQFEEYTGLSNRVVIKSIKELEDFGIIIKTGAKKRIGSFEINLNFDDSHLVINSENDEKSLPKMTNSHFKNDDSSYTKETLKKNKQKKEELSVKKTDSFYHYIISEFDTEYKKWSNGKKVSKLERRRKENKQDN